MSYNKILSKLKALPPDEQEFAAGRYVYEILNGKTHCGCAIGKLLSEEERVILAYDSTNTTGVTSLNKYLSYPEHKTAHAEIDELGANENELAILQNTNDDFREGSNNPVNRKDRYTHVIDWLTAQVRREDA